jgi:hypothetical protein
MRSNRSPHVFGGVEREGNEDEARAGLRGNIRRPQQKDRRVTSPAANVTTTTED